MAVIRVRDGVVWGGAASILAFIAERMQESGSFSRLNKDFDAIKAGWQHLDLSDLNEREREELRGVIASLVADAKKVGTNSGSEPHSAGFLARLEELQQLVCGHNSS